jgi:hypothetical protein
MSEGEERASVRALRGVRQGDILGPPLFNLFMAAVLITWRKKKTTERVKFFTDTIHSRNSFQIHGRPTGQQGVWFIFDMSLYADDAGTLAADRANLTEDLRGLMTHFALFGLELHKGMPGVDSKTVAVAFRNQPSLYTDPTTCDNIDLTPIVLVCRQSGTTRIYSGLQFDRRG